MAITPPTISLATSGTDPKVTTKQELESDVNGALASLAAQANTDLAATQAALDDRRAVSPSPRLMSFRSPDRGGASLLSARATLRHDTRSASAMTSSSSPLG